MISTTPIFSELRAPVEDLSRIVREFVLYYKHKIMEETGSEKFLEPERIVRFFGLEKGDHAADFGAGHGFFTIPMARIVGGDGKIYAVDVQRAVLDIIRAKARMEHLLNIEVVWADLEKPGGSRIKDKILDFVLISNILFQENDKTKIFEEAWRVLRENGRLAVVEWETVSAALGPPLKLRTTKGEVKNIAFDSRFKFEKEFEAGLHHFGLLFRKS